MLRSQPSPGRQAAVDAVVLGDAIGGAGVLSANGMDCDHAVVVELSMMRLRCASLRSEGHGYYHDTSEFGDSPLNRAPSRLYDGLRYESPPGGPSAQNHRGAVPPCSELYPVHRADVSGWIAGARSWSIVAPEAGRSEPAPTVRFRGGPGAGWRLH